jgi:membrane-associated phospholipid phosphatase
MCKCSLLNFLFILLFALNSFAQDGDSEYASPQEIRVESFIEKTGDILQIALPAAAGLSTLFLKDKKGFWQFAKSYGSTLILTYTLKYLVDKPRPDGAKDGHAFPSGHTASAFSGASFIQKRYGWAYGAPAYALAGFVAYSRVEGLNDRHDPWDVLGGAAVAIGSTYLFTTPYQQDHYELTFSSNQGDYILGVRYKF